MTGTILIFVIAILIFVGLFSLGWVFLRQRVRVEQRVSEYGPGEDEESGRDTFFAQVEKIVKPLGQMLPRSPEDLSKEAQRLMQAGIRRKDGVVLLYGARVALAIIFLLILMVSGYFAANPVLGILLPIPLGVLIPDMWLRSRIKSRKRRILIGLPDMMDLAVVCVESGLGLDQALQRIGQEIRLSHPDLGEELNLYGLEVSAGKGRPQALRNLANRTGVEDLSGFAALLIQSDRFGTSVAQSLRIYSDDLRVKRRQRAEEQAAKMSVKMIPPMLLFIFPAVFVVVVGPAIIAIVRTLFTTLGGG